MASPKRSKKNNIDEVFGFTGAKVVKSTRGFQAESEVVSVPDKKGFAKASPQFVEVEPDPKVLASKDSQKKAIEENTKKEEEDDSELSNPE